MASSLTVSEALDLLPDMSGEDVCVRGILLACSDGFYICDGVVQRALEKTASIWLNFSNSKFDLDYKIMGGLERSRVRVTGRIFEAHVIFGAGPDGSWPAQLLATHLVLDDAAVSLP